MSPMIEIDDAVLTRSRCVIGLDTVGGDIHFVDNGADWKGVLMGRAAI